MSTPLTQLPLFTLYDPVTQEPLTSVQAADLPQAYLRLQLVEELYSEPVDSEDAYSATNTYRHFAFGHTPLHNFVAFIVGPQDPAEPISWPVFLDHYFHRLETTLAQASQPP